MREGKIYKDTASTYEVVYYEEGKIIKRVGGIFEHDLRKFIKDYLEIS